MENQKYRRLLLIFFAVMVALTLLSRAADSVTVPRVTMGEARQGTLAFHASASGNIRAVDQEYIRLTEGLFIEKVCVGQGQTVTKGAILFELDLQSAQEQLLQAESQLAGLQAELRKTALTKDGSVSDLFAVEEAKSALERAEMDSQLNTEINGGKQLLADKRALEDAEVQLKNAEKQLAEKRAGADLALQQMGFQIKEKQLDVEKLQKICGSGGIVRAEFSGIVGSLTAEAGKKTTGESLCALIPENTAYVCEAEFSEDEAKYMKIGDSLSVTLPGKNTPLSDVKIRGVFAEDGKVKVTADIPKQSGVTGSMSVGVSHSAVTQSYPCTIPLRALRGTEGSYYVLTAEETKTVLGTARKAVRLDVTVLEMDRKTVALEGMVSGDIIEEASRPIQEGDRVRVVFHE